MSNKAKLLEGVIVQLLAEQEHLKTASRAAHEAATAEENKPENEYDTRALEAAYLAQAQGKRVQELQRMIEILKDFPTGATPQASSGSLLQVESEGRQLWYFLLPFGAGLATSDGTIQATVVSLDSPLGKLFLGKRAGDAFSFSRQGTSKEYEILLVC